jgi:DNA-binding SARP family transcriptional activator
MLEFRILGPIEVVRDGRPIPLGGAKQRALVADLVLHANEVVSADRLIDDLWGEEPPGTASHMLHVYVSRLRKTLEDHGRGVLVTRPPGYILELEPPDELDAIRFEAHVRRGVEALESRPADALETFDLALAWWRGRALEEFSDESFAQPSAARLEQFRQATHEHRVEALLALGRHQEALVELEALIARFPLRERLRELQMLALYRSGRQGDALHAFQGARRTLADELGVDPGPALASLEQAILRQDPELDAPATEPRAVEPRAVETRAAEPSIAPRRDPRRAWGIAAAIAIVAATVVVLVRVAGPGGPEGSSPSGAPSSAATLQWAEVADPGGKIFGGPGDQVILGGVATPDGLLVVGYTAARRPSPGSTRDYDAAVWTGSVSSSDWSSEDPQAFVAPGNQRATDAVVIPTLGTAVVVGSDASGGDHDATVWTRTDPSSSWARVDPSTFDETGGQWIRGVTWTGSTIVAVGYSRRHRDDDPAFWTSSDSQSWALHDPANLARPGDQQMSAVTTFHGLIVAVGFGESTEDRDAAIWFSRDGGLDWSAVPDPENVLGGIGDQQINDVVTGGPGLVAVGQETTIGGDENAAVWVSTDGIHWTRVEDPTGAFGGVGAQQMSAIAASGTVLIAAGSDVGSTTVGAIWMSKDGMNWVREPASPQTSVFINGGGGVRALLGTPDGFVALGRKGRSVNDADVWIGRLAA